MAAGAHRLREDDQSDAAQRHNAPPERSSWHSPPPLTVRSLSEPDKTTRSKEFGRDLRRAVTASCRLWRGLLQAARAAATARPRR